MFFFVGGGFENGGVLSNIGFGKKRKEEREERKGGRVGGGRGGEERR